MTKVLVGGSSSPSSTDGGVEADLLLGLAQRRRAQVGVARVPAAAGKRDLTGVPAQVGAALGEDEPRLVVGPAVERQQDRGVDRVWRLILVIYDGVSRHTRLR